MKLSEFYSKYKITYPPIVNPIFSKGNWWRIILISVVAVLFGPLILYKHQKSVPFSFNQYVRLSEYFVFIVVPLISLLIWANWRELAKRRRGYGWVGKFEVISKRSTIVFHYLLLSPGNHNQIKVNKGLFEKTNLGDFILIRRDAFGSVEEVSRINDVSLRLAKIGGKRFLKSGETRSFLLDREDDDQEDDEKYYL